MKSWTLNPIATASALALIVLFPNAPAVAQGCPAPSFAAARTFDAGDTPQSVAVGDYNGDAKPDLAVANYNSANVSLLLGNGDGTFRAAVNYGAGDGPRSVASGDFNGDGKLDLAVASAGTFLKKFVDGGVWALFGNGDGTFQVAVHYATGINASSIAVGDFNSDAVTDLAVANAGTFENSFTNGAVSVLLGNSNGTFQTGVNYSVGTYTFSVALGDFNGDGKPDLAAANAFSADISVLLNKGDGTFQSPVNYGVESSPHCVAVGDFNGDGKPDLVAANYYGNVSVCLGKGDGSFLNPRNYAAGLHPWFVAVGDFNGDGKPDLAVANNDPASVSVLLGKGDGDFQAVVSYGVGTHNHFVALGDFNVDSKPDLAVVDDYRGAVLLGNGDGTFRAPFIYGVGGIPVSVANSDFNGDGKLDLAVANVGSYDPSTGTYTNRGISLLLGNGEGTLQSASNYPGPATFSVATGDFNGDGRLDLAAATSEGISALLGKGDGTFFPAVNYGGSGGFVAVGDFNGDGKLDLATPISVLLGNGDGTFQTAVSYGWGGKSVAISDFNGDGKPDLAVANSGSNSVSLFLGNGDGTFKSALDYPAGRGPWFLAVADFNRDGKADLAVTHYARGDFDIYLDVLVLLGRGDGTFESGVSYGQKGSPLAVGDFNGDGRTDLVVATVFSADISVLSGNGDGTFQAAANFNVGWDSRFLAVGDFNGDGKSDLAMGNAFSGNGYVSILLNTCASAGIQLAIERSSDTTLTLFWPLGYTNFVLESTASVVSTNWQRLPESPTTNNERCEVTMPLDQPQRYFRLRNQ